MSHNVYLCIDTGSKEPVTIFGSDYTSNVSGMWEEALGYPLASLNGRVAADAIPDLRRAAWTMANNPDKYRAMNPANGWGNYEGAHGYLVGILEACLNHPKTTIAVSR